MLAALDRRLAALRPAAIAPRAIGVLAGVKGTFLYIRRLDCAIGDTVSVQGARGSATLAEVVGFEGDDVVAIILSGEGSLSREARVERVDAQAAGIAGAALLGRRVDAAGAPVDGRGPLAAVLPGTARALPRFGAGSVRNRLATGLRAIDALLTFGHGQRVVLVAGSGVGKTTLFRQIIDGAAVDATVVALVGERNREIADFAGSLEGTAAETRTVTVVAPADQSPLLRIRAAERATAIARSLAAEGRHVLLIIDSLTRVAHAQRELGLGLGEPPTMKGYPPSALAIIPRLVEQCGVDPVSGGSVTAVYSVLADGDDLQDPVVDAARAIADGHVVLSRALAEQGVYPAIDIGRSLSRVMDDIVDETQRVAAHRLRRLWALAEENRDLLLMGAYRPGADLAIDEALAARDAILAFVAQPKGEQVSAVDARAQLIAEFAP